MDNIKPCLYLNPAWLIVFVPITSFKPERTK